MATGQSWARWFAPLAALLMVVTLSGCFDKEGDQRKAFIDFLQNTAMRSGDRLPTLTSEQKKQFGSLVSDYAILYGFSQQMNQAMDQGIKPVVDTVNGIRAPQDYLTQRNTLRQENGALNVLGQQVENAKMQADSALATLKQPEELKVVFDKVYAKVVTHPAEAIAPLIPAAQSLTQQLMQVGDYIAEQDGKVSFNAGGVQFPTSAQATQYNALVAPLGAQHQAFMQAYSVTLNAMQ